MTVFGLFGALTIAAAATVQRYLPYGTVVIGFVLVALGVWLSSGRELTALTAALTAALRSALTPRPLRLLGPRWAPDARSRLIGMYGYGVSYAIASLSCTVGPFLAVTGAGFRSGSALTGVSIYVAYVAGLTLVVGVLAIAAATAGSSLADRLRRVLPFVDRISGILLVLVGLYVAYYGAYELRLVTGTANQDLVIRWAGRLQGALAGWVHEHGAFPWVGALLLLVAGAFAATRYRRVLSEPAAPTTPPVAHQDEERQDGEPEQVPVLDVTDVVAAQHRQQEDDGEQPGGIPGAVVDPAPSPCCGGHLGDVDAVVVLHLGTGHGESLPDRSASAAKNSGTPAAGPGTDRQGAQ